MNGIFSDRAPMRIINAHAHIYPDKIALKAAKAIGDFYDAPIERDGTVASLLDENKKTGISACLVHSVATTPHQVTAINDFLHAQMLAHGEFIGFMALHPDMDKSAINDEVEKRMAMGFKGVKLHPDFQRFHIDGKEARKIYEAVCGRLPILMHMGDLRYDYSEARRLVAVLNDIPELSVIAAHMGGYRKWEDVKLYHGAKYGNFRFDTSSSLNFLSKNDVRAIIKDFGCDRFFFGTDYPMWSAADELERFARLDLGIGETRMILGENLAEYLGLRLEQAASATAVS